MFGRQLIVEDNHSDFAFCVFFIFDILLYFFQLSLAYIGSLVRSAHFLRESLHCYGPCRVGKKFELVKIFFCLGLVLFLRD